METKNFKSQENLVEVENFVDPCGWVTYEIEVPVDWKDEPYYDMIHYNIKDAQNDIDFKFSIRPEIEWNEELNMWRAIKKFFRIEGWYHDIEIVVEDYLGFDDFDEKCEDATPNTL